MKTNFICINTSQNIVMVIALSSFYHYRYTRWISYSHFTDEELDIQVTYPRSKNQLSVQHSFPYTSHVLLLLFFFFIASYFITVPEANPNSEIMEKSIPSLIINKCFTEAGCIWQGNRLSCCNKETPNTVAQTKIELCVLSRVTVQGSGQFRVVHPGAQVHFSLPIF